MKKFATIAAVIGLTASIAATASAAEVTGTAAPATVTSSTYSNTGSVITPEDVKPATPTIILTRVTPFYFTNGSTMIVAGLLSPQTVDTTGQAVTDIYDNEWREVYTWLGLAWIKVPNSAYVIMP